MLLPSLLKEVNLENIYKHVMNLEGIRHPIQNFTHLDQSKEYIVKSLESCGIKTDQQIFQLQPFSQEFSNIEGFLGDSMSPLILLTSHYDTVVNCPGAIDNASAIAIMLECARILAKHPEFINVGFIFFTLEEFNASWVFYRNKKLQDLGLVDEKNRWKTYDIAKKMLHYKKQIWKYRQFGFSPKEAIQKYLKLFALDLNSKIVKFFEYDFQLNEKHDCLSTWGNSALIGSDKWVSELDQKLLSIEGVLNLDALGFRSILNSPHSAIKLHEESLSITGDSSHLTQVPKIQIIANKNSKFISDLYSKSCKENNIELEIIQTDTKKSLEEIAQFHPDLLRSDHTSFWKRKIPAIFITDYAQDPNPFYHTPADTIDKLDFNTLRKITQATLETIVRLKQKKIE